MPTKQRPLLGRRPNCYGELKSLECPTAQRGTEKPFSVGVLLARVGVGGQTNPLWDGTAPVVFAVPASASGIPEVPQTL